MGWRKWYISKQYNIKWTRLGKELEARWLNFARYVNGDGDFDNVVKISVPIDNP